MDRNTLTGFLLIAAVVLLLQYFNAPPPTNNSSKTEVQATAPASDSSANTANNGNNAALNAASLSSSSLASFGFDSTSVATMEEKYTLENEKIKIEFSNKGARPVSILLKGYKTAHDQPVILTNEQSSKLNFQIPIGGKLLNTSEIIFNAKADKDQIVFNVKQNDQAYIEHKYSLSPDSYLVQFSARLVGFNSQIPTESKIILDWQQDVMPQEHNLKNERNTTTVYYKSGEEVDRLSETSDDSEEKLETPVDWIGFKQQFFTSTLIANNKFDVNKISATIPQNPADSLIKTLQANVSFNYQNTPDYKMDMQFYFGPNHFKTLKSYNLGLEKQVKLGWGLFRWINQYAIIPIFDILSKFIGSYGIIILILTVLVKAIVFPLTRKALVSAAKMNALKPDLEEIQAKYSGDSMKIQQETMKVYSASGVSPFGGCLPSLLQLPLFFAMNVFFPAAFELRQQPFLWAKDLSSYDDIIKLPFDIPLLGGHISIFALLFSITTYLSIKMMANMTPSAGNNEQMKMMMTVQKIMPFGLFFLFNTLPSGLTYYFVISNLITLLLQWIIKKFFIDENAIRAEIAANKLKPAKQGFAARLEDMMKAQQAALEEKNKKLGGK